MSAAAQVTGTLSPRECHVGDVATLTVSVFHSRGVVAEAPAVVAPGQDVRIALAEGATLGDLEIVKVDPPVVKDAPDGQQKTRFSYQLTSFDVGSPNRPSFVMVAGADVTVPVGKLEVASVLPAPAQTEPGAEPPAAEGGADPRHQGALTVAPDFTLWMVIFAAAAVVAIALWLLMRKLRRPKAAPRRIVPPPPPYDEAIAALDGLKRRQLPAAGRWKDFAFHLSEILRRYTGRRYEIQALESTTRELMRDLRETAMADAARARLLRILEETDLVKFARVVPELPAEGALLSEAFAFVEDVRERPAAAPSPPPDRELAGVVG
ncbi:MAG: hypothetical protein U0166_13345 [Acidobacteriota bacterium]